MALTNGSLHNVDLHTLLELQAAHQEDAVVTEAELTVASELYRSGKTNTREARKTVEALVTRKLTIREDLNTLALLIHQRRAALV